MEDKTNRRKRNTEKPKEQSAKRSKLVEDNSNDVDKYTSAGKVTRIRLRNFMCHEALEITLNKNVNFIVGRNGSGKSAILTALTVGLGARANVTSRGTSVKEFIKKGQPTATIEITLTNEGDTAFKPETYGDHITIIRQIGTTSSYRIKNWRGEVISTKRNELDNIILTMNIQIDNPISVLNQDVSRTFLVASRPEEKYNLFMKATLLETIENNYKEALEICKEEDGKLQQYCDTLSQVKEEIEKLKENIRKVEEMDVTRAELGNLEMELPWAVAIEEEAKLRKIQEALDTFVNNLNELQDMESSVGTKNEEIDNKIKEITEKIQQTERERNDSHEAYNGAKQKYATAKEAHANKQRELRSVENQIKRHDDDIGLLKREIRKLENCNDEQYNERKEMQDRLSTLVEKLDEVEASIRTSDTELMHLEADSRRLSQEKQSVKIELDNCNAYIRKLERDLNGFEQQSDSALSVYGHNVTRLVRRIEEECKKGRFKEKPRGPLGAYIKLKDEAWAPAVESYLGRGALTSFCVDNHQDSKLLSSIMKEIFYNDKVPQIITSKFFHRVHDVRRHCTQSSKYPNLLEAMAIDDPIVANCLIDQREIECILLIPTNDEACEIMSDAAKVPRNCKRAFTQQGDTYFPDPNYRTYGGRCSKRAMLLQVSRTEAIQALKEELESAEIKRQEAKTAHNAICEKEERTKSIFNTTKTTAAKFKSMQRRCKEEIDNLNDKIESFKGTSADVFRHELAELEKKTAQERAKEKALAENLQELQENVKSLDDEVKRYKDLRDNIYTVIDPLREEIRDLRQEKEKHRFNSQRATQRLQDARQAVQAKTGEFEIQERATKKAVDDATGICERRDTTRPRKHIKALMANLRDKIREVEHQYGSVDCLKIQLQEKEEKYGTNINFMTALKESCKKHIKRVKERQMTFEQMRELYGLRIQEAFNEILTVRQYKGNMTIDHINKILDLNVSARVESKTGNDTRSLSGGERSYSTVAFILAMWDCIDLPFYFLDEFDVFMDKVNRRVIMDILLDHTKSHPDSQFCFLTPLDTSHILAEDYVTIHQLQPPERRGLSQ